jgi:drug/metabolite transporter (DMT)-like permease
VFIFVLALCYCGVAVVMFAWRPRLIAGYLGDPSNRRSVCIAVVAVVAGTVAADILMWIAIHVTTHRSQLPVAVALIHTVPVFSLLLVWAVYKEALNWKAVAGCAMTVAGCVVMLLNSGDGAAKWLA